uniref:Uncharacterized protein n=1 Tax=Arundo donax TaxID=35708 RepID=A0A0A8YPU4_ARUDO
MQQQCAHKVESLTKHVQEAHANSVEDMQSNHLI